MFDHDINPWNIRKRDNIIKHADHCSETEEGSPSIDNLITLSEQNIFLYIEFLFSLLCKIFRNKTWELWIISTTESNRKKPK